VLALTACQPKNPLAQGPIAQIGMQQPITLIAPVPDKQAADRLGGRVADYTQSHPNVTIDLRPINGMPRGPFSVDAWADLLQGVAAAADMDVANGWDVWAPGLIDRGVMRPLDPYLADIGRPLERYFMVPSVQAFRRFGRVWMLPWQAQPVMLFYNRRLFDQAALPAPEKRAKWGDIESLGGVLTRGADKSKTWGFDVGAALDVLIYQNGGRIVDDPIEPVQPTLDEQPNIDALAWVLDLIRRLKIMPSSTDVRGDQRTAAFANGQMGMRLDRMSIRGGQYQGSPKVWDFPWGVVPPPGRAERATSANFQSWGILANSTKVDEAWSFIRHICTRLPAEAKLDGVPAFLSLQGSPDLGRLLPEGTEAYMSALAETVPVPAVPAANVLQQLLGDALFKVISAQAEPADALHDAQKAALKAWGKQPKPTVVPQTTG
jgi:ABC-type glycerol-3-phosphate transport system substrate-binding protein